MLTVRAHVGRVDAMELAASDGDRATGHHLSLHQALPEGLLKNLALPVAVEDAADRRVPPVDDPEPTLHTGRLAETEIALLAVFGEAEVRKVR